MLDKDKKWRWCLVGNIVKDHAYGESKEILIGTKHFQPGAKVYMAPANWGDGYEKIVVIGCPRRTKHYAVKNSIRSGTRIRFTVPSTVITVITKAVRHKKEDY